MDLARRRHRTWLFTLAITFGLILSPAGLSLAQTSPNPVQTQWTPPKPYSVPGAINPGPGTEYCEYTCYVRSMRGRSEYGDGVLMPFPDWTICRDTCRVRQCTGAQTLWYNGDDASKGYCK